MNKLIFSFKAAFQGLKRGLAERNFRIHLFATILVIALGICYSISYTEWIIITLCIAAVLSAELFNTAIELICDFIEPNINPIIKQIKDLSAAAVLILALGAAIVGGIIFIPKILGNLT